MMQNLTATVLSIPDEQRKPVSLAECLNVFLLLSTSGLAFFFENQLMLGLICGANFCFFIYSGRTMSSGFLGFLLFLVLLCCAQILWFSDGDLTSYAGLFFRVLTGYLVVANTNDFIGTFIRVLFVLTIIAVLVFILFSLVPSVEQRFSDMKHVWDNVGKADSDSSLVIYNIHLEPGDRFIGFFGFPRNAGPFWEPGAFGGYLIIGILLEFFRTGRYTLTIGVFILGIFTTFSSTAFIAFFFLLFSLLLLRNIKLALFLLPLMVFLGVIAFTTIDFLGQKITEQFEVASQIEYLKSDNDSRFNSAKLDMKDLARSPVFGTGPSDDQRYEAKSEFLFFRTNGVTDALVRLGPIGFLFMLYNFFRTGRYVALERGQQTPLVLAFIFPLMILLISVSEIFLSLPFFWSLQFISYEEKQPVIQS